MTLLDLALIAFLIWFCFFSAESANNGVTGYVFSIIVIAILFVLIFLIFSNPMRFYKEFLYVSHDYKAEKQNRIQFKLKINYADIQEVDCCKATGNSQGRTTLRPYMCTKFIQLTLKNGKKKLLSIQWYSKRQKVKILEEIKKRMAYVGNYRNFDVQEMIDNLYKIPDFVG